jgi:DNA (cytosine-5)-methyltransferase 1
MSTPLTVLDLFCGCGGMSTGLTQAGLHVVAGIDIWDQAVSSYNANQSHPAYVRDLTTFSPEECDATITNGKKIDILVGGPPCQGFSIAGKRDNSDPRNSLFIEYVKYLNYFKPKVFLMENVMGILSMKTDEKELVIDIIMRFLTEHYECRINKLYASDFEVPQNRRRVIIIGVRKDLGIIPSEPAPVLTITQRIPVRTVLIPPEQVERTAYLSVKALAGIAAKRARSAERGAGFGAQILDLDKPSYTIPARYWKDGYDALVAYSDTELRRLTILELKRIQTFPDEYILNGTKKEQIIQIGNAVACRFAYHLGKYIKLLLE